MTHEEIKALFLDAGATVTHGRHVFTGGPIEPRRPYRDTFIQRWAAPTCSVTFYCEASGQAAKPALRWHCHSYLHDAARAAEHAAGRHDCAMEKARELVAKYGAES